MECTFPPILFLHGEMVLKRMYEKRKSRGNWLTQVRLKGRPLNWHVCVIFSIPYCWLCCVALQLFSYQTLLTLMQWAWWKHKNNIYSKKWYFKSLNYENRNRFCEYQRALRWTQGSHAKNCLICHWDKDTEIVNVYFFVTQSNVHTKLDLHNIKGQR